MSDLFQFDIFLDKKVAEPLGNGRRLIPRLKPAIRSDGTRSIPDAELVQSKPIKY